MAAFMEEAEPTVPITSRQGSAARWRWQAPSVEQLQEMLPNYEVLEIVGQGGMGAVYKGRQKSLRRTVAIKILPMDASDDETRLAERFKNEAYTLAQMSHPGIVNVFDFGETSEGLLYFVMEFVDGTDVSQMIQAGGRLAQDQALRIISHICEALEYAHQNGVIHRDIKPANVLINRQGQVKVADFGLAKVHDSALTHALTRSNTAMGTPDYVAPEVLTPGMAADHRADLYAVGVMLYQMLTGEVPRGMFKLPSQKVPEVDIRIDEIICKAMEQDREERYQTAGDVRRAVEEIQTPPLAKADPRDSPALPLPVAEPPKARSKRGVYVAVAGAVLVVVGALLVGENDVNHKAAPSLPETVAPGAAPKAQAALSNMISDLPAGGAAGFSAPTTTGTKTPNVSTWKDVTELVREMARGMPGFEVTEGAIAYFGKASRSIVLPPVDERDFAVRVRYSQQIQVDVRATPQLGFAYALIQGNQTLLQRYRADKNSTVQLIPIVSHPAGFDRALEHELLVTVVGNQIRLWLDGRWVAEGWDEFGKDGAARIMFLANSIVRSVEIAGLPAEAAKVANTSVKRAGRTVDLLAMVDVSRDPIRGTWTRSAGGISVAHLEGATVLQLPYYPPEEYDYEIEFTPDDDGRNVNQFMSAGGRSFAWKLNAHNVVPPLYGFELLDGKFCKDFKEAATQLDAALEKGRRYRSTIQVRRGSLRALLDDKELVRWSGDFKRFSMEDHSRLSDELHLGIGSWKRAVTFHKIQVTEVTGTGRVGVEATQAAKWTDWYGPRVAQGFFKGSGWIKVAEGVTTDQRFRGEIVLPGTTRDGAVRLGYKVRGSEAASVTFRHKGEGEDRAFYVAYDADRTLYISRAMGAEQTRLVSESIPAEIAENTERTLEVRFVGSRLTATLNGSFTVTAKDDTLAQGECAMVLHRGALLKKVETLTLDPPKTGSVNDDFMQMIASVNAPRQVELVGEKLKELNGVQPVLIPTIVSGKVTGLSVKSSDDSITNISPVAALRHLTTLNTNNNKVGDISCLAGLPLTELECNPASKLDAALLRSIPTLKIFNKKPVAEHLMQVPLPPTASDPGAWQSIFTKPEDFGENLKVVDPKCVEFRDGLLFLKDKTIVTKESSINGAVRATMRYFEGRTGSMTIRASEDVEWGKESFATGAYLSGGGKTVVLYVRHPNQKGSEDKHTFPLTAPVPEGDLFSMELRVEKKHIIIAVNGRQAGAVEDPAPNTKRRFGVMPPSGQFGEYREIAWQPLRDSP
jgi:hypothetical protein